MQGRQNSLEAAQYRPQRLFFWVLLEWDLWTLRWVLGCVAAALHCEHPWELGQVSFWGGVNGLCKGLGEFIEIAGLNGLR